jgi:hypothetical protein
MRRPHNNVPRLVEVLVRRGADEETLRRAVESFYGQCGEYLVGLGLVSQEELDEALAQQAAEAGDWSTASRHLEDRLTLAHAGVLDELQELVATAGRYVAHWSPSASKRSSR